MVVRYRVQDATGDPDREVEGRIRSPCRVCPRLRAPRPCRACRTARSCSRGPRRRTTAPTSRRTRCAPPRAAYTKKCAVDDLHARRSDQQRRVQLRGHGDEPRRRVRPVGAVGRSRAPMPVPTRPNPPTLIFGDKSLQVSWVTPSTPGSPVESFTLEISPAPPSGVTAEGSVTGNSLTWEGLENGTNYQIRVPCEQPRARALELERLVGESSSPPGRPRSRPRRRRLVPPPSGRRHSCRSTGRRRQQRRRDLGLPSRGVRGRDARATRSRPARPPVRRPSPCRPRRGLHLSHRGFNKAGWGA